MPARLLVPLALLGALAGAAPAHALDAGQVADRLARELRAAGPLTGAYAADLDADRTLFARKSTVSRVPASVNKLYTTAAALLVMGPEGRLPTEVRVTALPGPDGAIDGDLHLVGGGDPTLRRADLDALAARIADTGVTTIRGKVLADESAFDAVRGTPYSDWRPHTANGGVLGALVADRGWKRNGGLARKPAQAAAGVLSRALQRAGVRVLGRRFEAAPPAGVTLASHVSPTMTELARATNAPSDNFVAEMLLKRLAVQDGALGTTPEGAAAARRALAPLGVRPRMADGSGLSRGNRTTPREVVRLLDRVADGPVAAPFVRSLALTGRSGTVRRRMRGTPASGRCRVKTGTLRDVSTLAGVCTTRGGARVGFAWLMNRTSLWRARQVQDRMTAVLARYEP